MKKRITVRKLLAAALALTCLFGVPALVSATPLISQGYLAKGKISNGAIVSLQQGSTDSVELTTVSNANNIFGVVIGVRPPVSLSTNQANQVQVVNSGVERVLVADVNGDIIAGDPITASPISGVGMKATSNSKIIGVAQDNFPNQTGSKQTYKDKSGKEQSVLLGEIPVLVNVSYFYKQPDKTIIPQAIQNIANALAGRKVNALPILISLGIFVLTLIIVVSIIYAMIHSSIISVGRNPMSQSAVYRNVLQLSALVVVILMVAVVSIYMVLRKF